MSKTEKEIQNQVDNKLSEASKRKEENYKEIAEKYFPKKEKITKRKYIILFSSLSSVIVAVVLLFVFVIHPNIKNDSVIYYENNTIHTESNFEELSTYFDSLSLNIKKENISKIKRFYDSVTNDALYFEIDCYDGNVKSIIDFVVNQNYKIDISNLEYSIKYYDINVMYNYQCKMSNLNVNAFFEKNGQSIMIHSSMVSIDGSEQQFWDYIENIIIVN